jgi:hypothetical protein
VYPSLDVMYTGTQTLCSELMLVHVGHPKYKRCRFVPQKGIVYSGCLSERRFIAAKLEVLSFSARTSVHEIWDRTGVQVIPA